MWRPAFELGRGGRLVRAETTAQCVVVACWDSVLRAGRGLERVDRIPVTCARKGTTWKLPGAGGKGRGRTSVLRMHVHRVLVSWATPYVHTLRCVSLPYPLTGVVVAGGCCRYIRLHFLLKAQGCLRRYVDGYTAPSPTASQPSPLPGKSWRVATSPYAVDNRVVPTKPGPQSHSIQGPAQHAPSVHQSWWGQRSLLHALQVRSSLA